MKTPLMLAGLAAVFMIGIACSGFSSKAPEPSAACAGLEGQALADCEKRQQK